MNGRATTGLLVALAVSTAATLAVAGDDTSPAEDAYGNTPSTLVPYRDADAPYRRFYVERPRYGEVVSAKPVPAGLEAVGVGLLAPLEGTGEDDLGASLRRGVELALGEANAAGGYRGLPFELVARNDQLLWGASSNTLVDFAYSDRVWALIGSIDSNSTHVALRAALKAELFIVNVGSTDPTVTETGIPWILRATPDDRQNGYLLAKLLFEEKGFERVAVLRSNDRYGRFGIREFRDAARRLGRPLPFEVNFLPDAEEFGPQLERLRAVDAEAVLIWAKAGVAGRLLRQLRASGVSVFVAGSGRLFSAEFLREAGPAAEGVVVTAPFDATREVESWVSFAARYEKAYGAAPDMFAAYGYDAARLVIEAVRAAGLDRVGIRDHLLALRRYTGVTGDMQFDTTSNNVATPVLARVTADGFVFE